LFFARPQSTKDDPFAFWIFFNQMKGQVVKTMTNDIMSADPVLFEEERNQEDDSQDPDKTPIRDRRLVTQPYDIVIESVIDQIKAGTIHLRPLSDRPRFQRRYIWPNKLASRLIESILSLCATIG
jgi:hypothetical protein